MNFNNLFYQFLDIDLFLVFVFIFGLLIGSFLNVCIYRIPKEESIVFPGSHCTNCGRNLKPLELIPIFSYLFLKGRCKGCNEKVSIRYLLIELLTGFVFSILYIRFGIKIELLAYMFLFSILIAVFFIDYEHKIIPNGLVIAGLIGGALLVVYNLFYSVETFMDRNWWNPLVGMISGSGILLLVAIIGLIIYKSEDVMGMGDVKILAPIGLFLGYRLTLLALLLSIFIGGIISLGLMVLKIKNRKDSIPFGPFIVLGTFIAVVWGFDIIRWYLERL